MSLRRFILVELRAREPVAARGRSWSSWTPLRARWRRTEANALEHDVCNKHQPLGPGRLGDARGEREGEGRDTIALALKRQRALLHIAVADQTVHPR